MIPFDWALGIACVCLFLEAFFSGSEIALVSADRAVLRRKAAEGSIAAARVEALLARPQALFATTLLGTNLSVVVATSVITLSVLQRWPDRAEAITVAVLSPAVLVFGEIVPKTLFQQHADRLVTLIIHPLRVAAVLFRPVTAVFGALTTGIARLLRIEDRGGLVTREELRFLLESSEGEGPGIPEGERTMISNVLEFRETTVYDVMVPLSEVTALPEETSLELAALEIADKGHTRIPIYRERIDQIVGVVHAFDLLRAQASGHRGVVAELMRQPIYVPESKPTVDLLMELKRASQHVAVVVDEYGGATGICTTEDILEEIVGEIEDEHDSAQATIRPDGPGLWRVQGRTAIAQVNRALRLELPEGEDYESVAGFILDRLKRIPREGEIIRAGGATLTVLAANERAIEEVRIRADKRR